MMRAFHLRFLSCFMAIVFPVALLAADLPGAMLYSHGTALLNGNSISRSSAIFAGDLVQTNADSVANINATGSSVLVLNESLVEYQGNTLKLEHGGVTVSTSKLLATRAGSVMVSPVADAWTEFEVKDVDGKVQILARKGDLTVKDDSGTTTLAQGQETTRDDTQQNDKKNRRVAAAEIPGYGAALDSPWAIGIGGGIILGGTLWVVMKNDDPASPSK